MGASELSNAVSGSLEDGLTRCKSGLVRKNELQNIEYAAIRPRCTVSANTARLGRIWALSALRCHRPDTCASIIISGSKLRQGRRLWDLRVNAPGGHAMEAGIAEQVVGLPPVLTPAQERQQLPL